MKKRGISPVIATVLLIAMVIVIALIIFLWFKSLVGEEITKFGENVKIVCEDVSFETSYSQQLLISNTGNVPIFGVKVKQIKNRGHDTISLNDLELRQGGVFSGAIDVTDVEKMIVIPVLMGNSDSGMKTYVCDERYGQEIYLG